MKFKFNNYSQPTEITRGKYHYYKWMVFMDESEDKLKLVRSVEYRLHETFANRIRIIEDRKSKFALKTTGWGNFWIKIIVHLTNEEEIFTKYYLDLNKTWPSPTPNG